MVTYINMGPWPVFVGYCTSRKAFKQEMRRLGVKSVPQFITGNMTTHIFDGPTGALCCIIACPPMSKHVSWEAYAALVAHEALHVAQEMRLQLNKGQCLGAEAEAYIVQYITQSILQDVYKTGREHSIKP